jgi:chromosome segregation ATPase
MRELSFGTGLSLCAVAVLGLLSLSGAESAQTRIVCWKNQAGKVIGCGDKVPPEFEASATKELDARGVTRRTTESVAESAQRRAREEEAARLRGDEERRSIEQKRQDMALLQTYSNEKEIDLKRDRDLQVLDLQMEQLHTGLKSATARYDEMKSRVESLAKMGKAAFPALKEDLARATADKARMEERIEAKQKEKEELRQRYAEYSKRYTDLRNGTPVGTPIAAKR